MQMIEELYNIKATENIFDIIYLDFKEPDKVVEHQFEIEMATYTKTVELSKIEKDTDLKLLAAEFLKANVKTIEEMLEKDGTQINQFTKDSCTDIDELKRKLRTHLNLCSNFIATNGRFGYTDIITMSQKTYDTYHDEYHPYINGAKTVINNYIEDDTFYLIKNSDSTQPGFKCFYKIENDETYLALVGVGRFPEKQACKFVIY